MGQRALRSLVVERHNDVLPFDRNPDLNGIEHSPTKVHTPKTTRFVERFDGTVPDRLSEMFRLARTSDLHDEPQSCPRGGNLPFVHAEDHRR